MMGHMFGRHATNGAQGDSSSGGEAPIVQVPLHKTLHEHENSKCTFSCWVQLDKKVILPAGKGMQVGVEIQDPRIEPDGLYTLELDPLLSFREDLRVASTLATETEAGKLTVMTGRMWRIFPAER